MLFLPGSFGLKAAECWSLYFGGCFVVGEGGFLGFTHLAVVRASNVILHHKNKGFFPLVTLQLLFLKQHSPQKCNIGTCHRTTEPKAVNSPHNNKCGHYQTLQGERKKGLFFCLACISHKLPFFFLSSVCRASQLLLFSKAN